MIVSFKFYVMNFVDFVFNCYTHFTSQVSQVFASCTHYTSYSLLNIVHIIVCVSRSDQPSLQLLWVFVQNIFCVWEFKGRVFENLKFGKTGFKTCVLEKHFISYSCILFLLFNSPFFKSFQTFFSLSNSARLHNKFFVVFLLISCKVFLFISRYVHYTLSFSFIFSFTCIFSCIGGLFFGLCINLGFWCFKLNFVKLINGFSWYIVIFMIYVG